MGKSACRSEEVKQEDLTVEKGMRGPASKKEDEDGVSFATIDESIEILKPSVLWKMLTLGEIRSVLSAAQRRKHILFS